MSSIRKITIVTFLTLLLGGSLLIPAALVEASAGGSPSGLDTTQVTAEAISQAPDDIPAELGLLGYFFKRKQTDDGEQAPVGVDVPEAHNGPVEELGLIDLLLSKKPQSLVMAAGIPVANGPEPVEEPWPEEGLIKYFSNRRNTSIMPAADPAPAVNRTQPTPATAKSSISTSQVPSNYTTAVESAAISDGQAPSGVEVKEAYDGPMEKPGLLDILLGKEPQPQGIAAGIPEANEPVPEPEMDPLPELSLIDYFINQGNTSLRPAVGSGPAVNPSQPTHATAKSSISPSQVAARSGTAFEPAVISEDLLRIKVVLGQLPRSALASLEQSNQVAATPKIENDALLVENTEPQLDLTQKHDPPGPATAADVEGIGLLELLLQRHPDAARVEAMKTPSGDNNGN